MPSRLIIQSLQIQKLKHHTYHTLEFFQIVNTKGNAHHGKLNVEILCNEFEERGKRLAKEMPQIDEESNKNLENYTKLTYSHVPLNDRNVV